MNTGDEATALWRAGERIRITWAIAAKDITDAVKNKTILTVVLGMAMLMLSAQAFPFLLRISAPPRVVVYDAGRQPGDTSYLVSAMAEEGTYRLIEVESPQAMEAALAELNAEALGLAIPIGFEQMLESGGQGKVEGHVVWARRSAAGKLAAEMQRYLETLLQKPVQVEAEGNWVYPPPEGTRSLGTTAAVLTLILVTTGGLLAPYLIFEEKLAHTMDALLVSPARVADVITGKALAGIALCLAAMAVALAFSYSLVAGWGVAMLAVLVGALFAVGVGLLMGTIFETPQQMGAWTIIPIATLMLPIMLAMLGPLPPILASTLPWLPTIAVAKVFLLSFSGSAALLPALPDLALVLAWTAPLYGAVIWIVRRSDR